MFKSSVLVAMLLKMVFIFIGFVGIGFPGLRYSNIHSYIVKICFILFYFHIYTFILYLWLMNQNITKLFSCCSNNRIVVIDTNFKDFCECFRKMEPNAKSCRWFINKFKVAPEFEYEINDKLYYFQKLV